MYFDAAALSALAGAQAFARGEDYHRGGRVRSLLTEDDQILGLVEGQRKYAVRLWQGKKGLSCTCSCPLGHRQRLCKHRVAVGLFWLAQQGGGPHRVPPCGRPKARWRCTSRRSWHVPACAATRRSLTRCATIVATGGT